MAMEQGLRRSQKYEDLRKQLLDSGDVFVDHEFPATFRSIFPSGVLPNSMNVQRRDFIWMRPKQLSDNPKFMEEKASRFDIDQGVLGDCWFLSAAGSLFTGHQKYLKKVMPFDQSFEPGQYTGMFRFNFWWYGDWKEIIIDDQIPCVNGQPAFSKNAQFPNEFWPCLLEKAYAKLRGGFWNMDGGIIGDAMVDMTGGVSEHINNDKLDVNLLKKSFALETLLGAGCMQQARGLQPGHAYLISGLKDLTLPGGNTVQLIRLRNPWGDGHEWNGPWSDKSAEMASLSPSLKKELDFEAKDDGEFWMTLSDYRIYFAETHFCHVDPDTILEELDDNERKIKWNVTTHHDSWVRGVSSGGWTQSSQSFWRNPQFFVTLNEPDCHLCDTGHCTLIASLLEKQLTTSSRSQMGKGFFVFEVKGESVKELKYSKHVDQQDIRNITNDGKPFEFSTNREVTQRFELPPGTYAIIPCTTKPYEEAEFMLRVYTENHSHCGVTDKHEEHEHEHSESEETASHDHVFEAFEHHKGEDGKMYPMELGAFTDDLYYTEFDVELMLEVETCRNLVLAKNKLGYLNYIEARAVWDEIRLLRAAFTKYDYDHSETVDSMELKDLLKHLKLNVSRDVLAPIVRRYGGRETKIVFVDFVMIYTKLKIFAGLFKTSMTKEEFLVMSMSV